MSDVFLSYAREDLAKAALLAKLLDQRGWSVFWDYDIRVAEDFKEKIEKEAGETGCLIVLWSTSSVGSEWVLKEADIGTARNCLLPIRIEDVTPPRAHKTKVAVDLVDWDGDPSAAGFKDLLDAIIGLLGGEPWKRKAFEKALDNIEHFGDTDVLPYPIERQILTDNRREALNLLQTIDAKFEDFIVEHKPYYSASLYPAGFYGYRWVTQIDPIWNAYLLGLVTAIGDRIEAARLPAEDRVVFSYRFAPSDEGHLFTKGVGYHQYQERSLELAEQFSADDDPASRDGSQVVVCDIADFYPRLAHDHVRQALENARADQEVTDRIVRLLRILSGGDTYGLPVGGPAARLLSELALHSVDQLLGDGSVVFCRFADDYHLFVSNKREARDRLMLLSQLLYGELGLVLQKSKTRIMSTKEFIATSPLTQERRAEDGDEEESWTLLKLAIPFDPYSEDRVEEYERFRDEIIKYDIGGLLARELGKSRPDPTLTRKLIDTVRFLRGENRYVAVKGLVDRLENVYPLLANVLRTFRHLVVTGDASADAAADGGEEGLDEKTALLIFDRLSELITSESYLMRVPAYFSYAVRVLVHDPRPQTTQILNRAYEKAPSIVRRDIILAMGRRRRNGWINMQKRNEKELNPWERRALLIASRILGTAGERWRATLNLSPSEILADEWAEQRTGPDGTGIPL